MYQVIEESMDIAVFPYKKLSKQHEPKYIIDMGFYLYQFVSRSLTTLKIDSFVFSLFSA